jgi:hypothetical protein
VTFAGPAPRLAAHALHTRAGGLEPHFTDVRAGTEPSAVRAAILRHDPHVVVALDVDPEALAGLPVATLTLGAAGGDRVLGRPGDTTAWRARPLPVDDRLYAPAKPATGPPRALCLTPSTGRREWLLMLAKHDHDVVHYAHGLTGDALSEQLARADVGIAVAAEADRAFPDEALIHLAAGHLLLAERFNPTCGLEAGIDHVLVTSREDVVATLTQLRLYPEAYERLRVRGRLKAEEHRASAVWPRLVRDLLEDVRVFGSGRAGHGNTLEA